MTTGLFATLVARDLRLAARRRADALLPLAFFTVSVSLFPLGVGPEAQTLRQIAPGVVWVAALLAAMLSVTQLYAGDLADGSLEQMLLAAGPGTVPDAGSGPQGPRRRPLPLALVAGKAAAHWLLTGLPLVIAAPLFGLMFDMRGEAILALALTLLLGTPVLSLLGGLGAALTLGLRSSAALLILLIVPLCIPALIFGAGAVAAIDAGLSARGHYSLLGALLIFTALIAPPATAAALRIATD
jgi:heme exporter protein B